jgi:epsilon-lactone hydrolase
MSLRLRALNLVLRNLVKPRLAATTDPMVARRDFAMMSLIFRRPMGVGVTVEPGAPDLHWLGPVPVPGGFVILFFHGGAYIFGSARSYRGLAARLARLTGLPVLLPDYRLAPEHKAPAAYEDARAAHAALIARGFAADRIVLGGDSAGGGMALALLADLCARDLRPAAVFALSPWTDLSLSGASLRTNAESDALLPVSQMTLAVAEVRGAVAPDDPRLSPLFARYAAPPPVLIQVGDSEILLDDSRRMAALLRAAGGRVEVDLWHDTPHVFHLFDGYLPEARQALKKVSEFVGGIARATDSSAQKPEPSGS